MTSFKILARNIKYVNKEILGWSQVDLGSKVGLKQSVVSRILNGKRELKGPKGKKIIIKIITALNDGLKEASKPLITLEELQTVSEYDLEQKLDNYLEDSVNKIEKEINSHDTPQISEVNHISRQTKSNSPQRKAKRIFIPALILFSLFWICSPISETLYELPKIISPRATSKLPKKTFDVIVKIPIDSSKKINSDDLHYWLIIEQMKYIGMNRKTFFWPKKPKLSLNSIKRNNEIQVRITQNGGESTPKPFSLALFLVTDSANNKIKEWFKIGEMTGSYPPFESIQRGWSRLDRVDNLFIKQDY